MPSRHFSTSPSADLSSTRLAKHRLASLFCHRIHAMSQPVEKINRLLASLRPCDAAAASWVAGRGSCSRRRRSFDRCTTSLGTRMPRRVHRRVRKFAPSYTSGLSSPDRQQFVTTRGRAGIALFSFLRSTRFCAPERRILEHHRRSFGTRIAVEHGPCLRLSPHFTATLCCRPDRLLAIRRMDGLRVQKRLRVASCGAMPRRSPRCTSWHWPLPCPGSSVGRVSC